MKHLTLLEYGTFAGIRSELLIVKTGDQEKQFPLKKLRTISISKKGITFSSDLILECSNRGIKLFFLDFKGVAVSALQSTQSHAVVRVRHNQFSFIDKGYSDKLAREFIRGKLKNQRGVLLYNSKYLMKKDPTKGEILKISAERIKQCVQRLDTINIEVQREPKASLLGLEGAGAAIYWTALRDAHLMPESFEKRIGRGASDPVNSALNYGYAILTSYVWHCVINAGLEPYAGLLHEQRPGKPALVLDIMEEYRPFVVDRVVLKMRNELSSANSLSIPKRKRLINEIHKTFSKKMRYKGKSLKLESILQRQIYRLAGSMAETVNYRPYIFDW